MEPAVMIIRAVSERQDYVEALTEALPDAQVVWDQRRDAMDTFLRALELAGRRPAIHMEDDIILAPRFRYRVESVIADHPRDPVQFFSLREKADRRHGSRREPGSKFLMGQCFYLPEEMSRDLRGYADYWRVTERGRAHPTGLDLMVADFLRERRLRYWHHVPSLVQHRDCRSVINPRRARSRQSPTFEEASHDG